MARKSLVVKQYTGKVKQDGNVAYNKKSVGSAEILAILNDRSGVPEAFKTVPADFEIFEFTKEKGENATGLKYLYVRTTSDPKPETVDFLKDVLTPSKIENLDTVLNIGPRSPRRWSRSGTARASSSSRARPAWTRPWRGWTRSASRTPGRRGWRGRPAGGRCASPRWRSCRRWRSSSPYASCR